MNSRKLLVPKMLVTHFARTHTPFGTWGQAKMCRKNEGKLTCIPCIVYVLGCTVLLCLSFKLVHVHWSVPALAFVAAFCYWWNLAGIDNRWDRFYWDVRKFKLEIGCHLDEMDADIIIAAAKNEAAKLADGIRSIDLELREAEEALRSRQESVDRPYRPHSDESERLARTTLLEAQAFLEALQKNKAAAALAFEFMFNYLDWFLGNELHDGKGSHAFYTPDSTQPIGQTATLVAISK